MPVLHSYVDKRGFYIRSRVEGNPITFQITPTGEQLLRDLGFQDESEIPWGVFSRLYEEGDVYTRNSGIDDSLIKERQDNGVSGLSKQQQERFRDYLDQGKVRPSIRELTKSVKEILDLSMSALAERKLGSLKASPKLEKSLDYFKSLPYTAQDLTTDNNGDIVYTFDIGGSVFRCTDSRWSTLPPYHFEIEYGCSEEKHRVLHITDGWFTTFRIDEGPKYPDLGVKEVHTRVYRSTLSLAPIRELFIHLPHYDVRPDPENPGHNDLESGFDLLGKHIWATPERYTGSNKKTKNKIVDCEMKRLLLSTHSWEPCLVEVRGSKNGEDYRAAPIEQAPPLGSLKNDT